jgi:outer membrane protein OmpA-like peptidoglycan-associated protein
MKKFIPLLLGAMCLLQEPGWAQSNNYATGGKAYIAESVSAGDRELKAAGSALGRQIERQGFASIYIGFAFNSADILPEYMTEIKSIRQLLEQQADLCLLIQGHTDGLGHPAYNQELSLRRAVAIKDTLIGMGIAADRLAAEGKGASAPVANNSDPAGREKNRRVELHKRQCGS